jgi:hypothetical protein
MVRTLILLIAAVWLLAGCGKDEKKLGAFYDSCSVKADCEDPLECRSGLCNINCSADATLCRQFGTTVECQGGTCYKMCENRDSDCDTGMHCCNIPLT